MSVKYPVFICKIKRWICAVALSQMLKFMIEEYELDYRYGLANRKKKQLRRVNRLLDHGDPWHDKTELNPPKGFKAHPCDLRNPPKRYIRDEGKQ